MCFKEPVSIDELVESVHPTLSKETNYIIDRKEKMRYTPYREVDGGIK